MDDYRLISQVHVLKIDGDGRAIQDSVCDAGVLLLERWEELA